MNAEMREVLDELKKLVNKDKNHNEINVTLKARPHSKVSFLDNEGRMCEGFIKGYWISGALNVTYKIQKTGDKTQYDVKEQNIFTDR